MIIEVDPISEGAPVRNHGEAEHLCRARRHNYSQLHQSAWKHLATLAANCWVIPSEGPACTLALMRYIEANIDLKVRNIRVKGPKGSARRRILAALPGVNPDRELPDGPTVGDALEAAVDWNKLADALNLAAWARLDLGKGAKGFGLGTLSRVSDALRRPFDDVRCLHRHAKVQFTGDDGPSWRFACPNDSEALNSCPGVFPGIGRNVWDWREPKGPSTSKLVLGDGRTIPLGNRRRDSTGPARFREA